MLTVNWPSPQRGFSVQPIDTAVRRQVQSGRTEVRRFGSGAPDKMDNVIFRFNEVQFASFKNDFYGALNLGVKWFTASWLPGKKMRIIGQPRMVCKQGHLKDVSVSLLVLPADAWTSSDDGIISPPLVGRVKCWGGNFSIVENAPTNLYAKKIITANGVIAAIKPDGTVFIWGNDDQMQSLAGWESLSGIKDLAIIRKGLIYLNDSGEIRIHGNGYLSSFDNKPAISGFNKIAANLLHALAVTTEGFAIGWGAEYYPPRPSGLNSCSFLAADGLSFLAKNSDGSLFCWGYQNSSSNPSHTASIPESVGADPLSVYGFSETYAVAQKETGEWIHWGAAAPVDGLPNTLTKAIKLVPHRGGGVGIDAYYNVFQWGGTQIPNKPAGMKAIDVCCRENAYAVALVF